MLYKKTIDEALPALVKILHKCREELKEKTYITDLGVISEKTQKFVIAKLDDIKPLDEVAKKEIENEQI